MVVGGYTLDLYCDAEDSWMDRTMQFNHHYAMGFQGFGTDQFTGETQAECRAQAKKKGWLIERGGMRAMCPICRRAGRVLPPLEG